MTKRQESLKHALTKRPGILEQNIQLRVLSRRQEVETLTVFVIYIRQQQHFYTRDMSKPYKSRGIQGPASSKITLTTSLCNVDRYRSVNKKGRAGSKMVLVVFKKRSRPQMKPFKREKWA